MPRWRKWKRRRMQEGMRIEVVGDKPSNVLLRYAVGIHTDANTNRGRSSTYPTLTPDASDQDRPRQMTRPPRDQGKTRRHCDLPRAEPQGGRPIRPALTIARVLLKSYQLTLSALIGRQCRHLPTCSEYMDEAMVRHGLWAGGWMGVARICRCNPFGTHGLDFVPDTLPQGSRWYIPWRYGRWRGTNETPPFVCEATGPGDGGAPRTSS